MLHAAASVLEYRARSGEYPASLADAVQPAPLDPCDQKPLVYHRTAKGFVIEALTAANRWAALRSSRNAQNLVFRFPPEPEGK